MNGRTQSGVSEERLTSQKVSSFFVQKVPVSIDVQTEFVSKDLLFGESQNFNQIKKFVALNEFRIFRDVSANDLRLVEMAELYRKVLENIG